jgi:iron complex outermembrane recepter protein
MQIIRIHTEAFVQKLFPLSALALAASALFTGAVRAQVQPAATDDGKAIQTLPSVTVRASADASADGLKAPYAGGQVARGGRVGILGSKDVMDTPFSITNYTQALIQNQQAASIADVLQNDPAVRVARGFGNFQQVYIIRGFPVFSDDMAYNGLYGLLPRQYLAAELVERVEVLRGSSAFLNGAAPGNSGLGGAINVMPKRAPNEPLNEVTLGVQSGGEVYAAADIARRFGPDQSTGIRISAVQRQGDTAVDGEHRKLSAIALGGDFHSGNLRLSADLGYQNHELRGSQPNVTIAGGVAVPSAPDAKQSFAQPWTFSNERDTFGTLRGEYDIANNVTAWAAYGFRRGDESTDLSNPTVTDAAGDMTSYRFVGSRTDRISTGEVGVRANLQTGGIAHTLIASAATYTGKTDAPYAFSDFGGAFLGTLNSNLYAPTASAAPAPTALIGDTVTNTKTSSVAVADTMSFFHDSVLLSIGLRNQRIENDTYDKSKVTPVTGLVFKASKMVSLYATYIEGLVQGDTAPATAGAVVVANAGEQFAPFQIKQGEVGVKVDTGRFGGTFSLFEARKPIYSVDPTSRLYAQTDKQRNRGAELSVYGEAMPGLRLLGGASLLHTDVAGNDAIGSPKSQFNLGADWDVPGVRGLALNALGVHTAAQFADAANTQVVPAWTRLDLGARYAMMIGEKELTIRARVNNATGRNYWASAGGYPGAGYLVVGEPRTFILTGTVAF